MIKLILIGTSLLFSFNSWSAGAPESFISDIDKFQQNNPNSASLKALSEAASDRRFSKSLFWTPTVDLSASKTRDTIKGNTPTESDYWQAAASLNLFKGGKDWAQYQAARADEKNQLENIKDDQLNIERSASNLIFKKIFLKEVLKIQFQLTQTKEDALKIVKDRYSAGQISKQEVTKYEVDYSQQLNTQRLAQTSIDENEVLIKSAFVEDVKSESWPFSENIRLRSENQKIPSIEKKAYQLESYEQSWKAASRSFWPTLDVSLSYSETPIKERTTQETITSLVLNIPIWSRYETSAAKSTSYAGYLQAESDLKLLKQTNNLNQDFLIKKIEILRANLVEATENLKKSKLLYADMVKVFRIGKLSTNDLLQEQTRLIESERNVLTSQLSFHQSIVELCNLRGQQIRTCLY